MMHVEPWPKLSFHVSILALSFLNKHKPSIGCHDEVGERVKHMALRMSTKVLEFRPHAHLTIEEESLVTANVEETFARLAFGRL